MATIKSYTDIEQSKKLAEILPLYSADCFWDYDDLQKYHHIAWFDEGYNKDSQLRLNKNNVPAWSCVALLGFIPNYKLSSEHNYHTCTAETSFGEETVGWFDSPVDACYEMILKLKKLKLLFAK